MKPLGVEAQNQLKRVEVGAEESKAGPREKGGRLWGRGRAQEAGSEREEGLRESQQGAQALT